MDSNLENDKKKIDENKENEQKNLYKKDKLSLSILNSNICTTYRMDFCEEIIDYNEIKCQEIEPYKSKHRLSKILALLYTKFYEEKTQGNLIPIFCIQELRTYNKNIFFDFFEKINYQLYLFPTYPDIITEDIKIDKIVDKTNIENKHKIDLKRFSFINGIALPKTFIIENEFKYYLSDTPDKFKDYSDWGHSGSRICGGLEISTVNKIRFKVFTTQFGMDVNERLKSAELIANIMLNENLPVILTGDFNSFSNLDEKIDLKGNEQIKILENVLTRLPINRGTFIGMRPVEKELYCMNIDSCDSPSCLDHIFIRGKNINFDKFDVILPENKEEIIFPYSDHCMIWANIEIKF